MSISTNKARRTGKDFNQVIEDLAEDLAEDMAEGKTSADIATVDTANASNKNNGGYVGLQVQTANKQTDTSISTMKAEMKVGLLSKDVTLSALRKESNTQVSAKKAKSDADNTAIAMGAVAGSATALATAEGVQKVVNYAKGNRIAKEDMTYTDANGNEKTIKKGQSVNVSNNAELKELYENNKGKFKTEGGLPSKFMDKLYSKGNKESLFTDSSDNISNSSNNKPTDVSTNSQDSHTKNEIKNESSHSDSSSKDIKDDTIKRHKNIWKKN